MLERLRKIDGALAATLDPVAPRKMRGPFATLAELCKALDDCKVRMAQLVSSTCGTKAKAGDGSEMKLDGDSLELTPATFAKSISEAQLGPPGKHALVFP